MRKAGDGMQVARAQLYDRIDGLARDMPRMGVAELGGSIDDIRRAAHDCGLEPLARLARGLEAALAEAGRAALALPWLDAMRDAALCDRADHDAGTVYLAAVNVRMIG